nr:uncharacterized protein LOC128686664 [Cherax quadricarinatus]
MKSLLVLLLVALSSATVIKDGAGTPCDDAISDQCPAEDGPDPLYIAVPENCQEYCECSQGTAYLFECGEDTLFDDVLKECNWATHVNCGSRPIPGSSTSTTTTTTATTTTTTAAATDTTFSTASSPS